MNLTEEQKIERRRRQGVERYQCLKKQREEDAGRKETDTDVQCTIQHVPAYGNTPFDANKDHISDSSIPGAIHGLALRQKSDESELRWIKSFTPENYTVTAADVNVRDPSLNPSLIIAPEGKGLLAPSIASDFGGSCWAVSSQRPSIYMGGPVLESVETATHQSQMEMEIDPLLWWLNDFTLYDNNSTRNYQPNDNNAALPSISNESMPPARSAEIVSIQASGAVRLSPSAQSVDDEELNTFEQTEDPETGDLRCLASEFLLSQLRRPSAKGEAGEIIGDSDLHLLLSLAQVAEHIQNAKIPDALA
jgi:hypothetical protein